MSHPVFQVIDKTVHKILAERQLFWVTLGAAIAVWEVSGAMRATMQVLNRVYGVAEERSFWRKLWESIALSTVVTLLLLLAAGSVKAGLLLAVVMMVVRFAPDTRRPVHWVTFGGLLVIVGWILMSLLYGAYVTQVADYASIFGSLAVVMVTMSYIYLSAIVFLTGVQLDSLIRHQVEKRADPE